MSSSGIYINKFGPSSNTYWIEDTPPVINSQGKPQGIFILFSKPLIMIQKSTEWNEGLNQALRYNLSVLVSGLEFIIGYSV